MKYCSECQRQMISLGFGYYHHPVLVDYHGRVMSKIYQCSLEGDTMKLDKVHEKKPVSRQLHLFDI